MRHLEPYWGDAQTALLIDAGVAVSGMPSNAEIIGSPGYRAGVDGGLYELDQAELQAVHERTRSRSGEQARETAIQYDIPIGQQVHACRELREKLWPRHHRKRGSYPRMNDWLDQMMPKVNKRTRERHLKTFAIVTSDEWPDMVALAEEEITGMESILRIAKAFSPPGTPKKVRTPLKVPIRHSAPLSYGAAMRRAGGSLCITMRRMTMTHRKGATLMTVRDERHCRSSHM